VKDHLHAPDLKERDDQIRKFSLILGLVLVAMVSLPNLLALGLGISGSSYLGSVFNSDDHMVYAAWIRQASEGAILFDNRFTTEPQPGQTFHLYFLVLGWVAKFIGVTAATTSARLIFSFTFVWMLGALLRRSTLSIYACKLSMIFAVFGGGLGFLVWHKFGRMIVSPRTTGFSSVFGGLLPVDVWQPEVGVFSSALTNGLFMISLTLMVVVLVSAIDAQQSWKSVIPGAVALGILMNIHSYDVMLIGLILVGFLITIIAQKEFSGIWLGRIAAMCAGIIPGAYWFLHTLATDPVFQERAATPTFSPNFRALLLGIFPAWALMLVALRKLPEGNPIAVSVFGAGTLGLAFALSTVGDFFPMTWAGFAISVICAGIVVWFGSRKCHFWNLMLAWAVFGILAPYAPVLFQRKLAAGLIIPFAILGALGLGELMKNMDRIQRNLLTTVLGVTLGMSSVMWLQRDALLIRDDVSTTTVQPAFLSEEMSKIISIISNTRIQDGDKDRAPNVVAVPGIPSPTGEPDRYARPYFVDMNPIVSGLAGAYTYAGHWSETPKYAEKRSETMRILFTGQVSSQEQISWLGKNKIDFVIAPNIKNYPDLPYRDLRGLGEIQLEGPEFLLIRLTR